MNRGNQAPRDYVIFCGGIFGTLLKPYCVSVGPEQQFTLKKANGMQTNWNARCTPLVLKTSAGPVPAMVASSFARRGLPMAECGWKIAGRYQK